MAMRARRRLALAMAACVAAVSMASPVAADDIYEPASTTAPPATAGIGELHPMAPKRVLSTGSSSRITPSTPRIVKIGGVAPIPATGVAAVAVTITASSATVAGSLTVYGYGATPPTVPHLTYRVGERTSNVAIVRLGTGGQIVVRSSGTTHVTVDVVAMLHSAKVEGHSGLGLLQAPSAPRRVFDSRSGSRVSSTFRSIKVVGVGPIPATGVTAVVVNFIALSVATSGSLTVWPSDAPKPTVPNVQFVAGATTSGVAIVKPGADGTIRIAASGSTHVVADVQGWFRAQSSTLGGQLTTRPARALLDTRSGSRLSRATRVVTVLNQAGVPATGVAAVVVNVTASSATTSGTLTLYGGTVRPAATNLHYRVGDTASNLAVVPLGSDGKIRVYSSGTTHVRIDIAATVAKAGVALSTSSLGGPLPPLGSLAAAGIGSAATTSYRVADPRPMSVGDLAGARASATASAQPDLVLDASTDPVVAAPYFPTDQAGYTGVGDSRIGRIYFRKVAGGTWSFCSGTVVAPRLVLTAGHCLNDAVTHQWYAEWYFVPKLYGSLASAPFGTWTATEAYSNTLWTGQANFAADFGFLEFDPAANNGLTLGTQTGTFPLGKDSPGGLKYSYGYPGEGWFGRNGGEFCDSDPSAPDGCFLYFCVSRIASQNQYQFNLADPDPEISYGGWWEFGIGCYHTAGASGGPIFEYIDGTWQVVGVNSHIQTDASASVPCADQVHTCRSYARHVWSPYFNQFAIDQWTDLQT